MRKYTKIKFNNNKQKFEPIKKTILSEIFTIGIILGITFITSTVFINAQVFSNTLHDIFFGEEMVSVQQKKEFQIITGTQLNTTTSIQINEKLKNFLNGIQSSKTFAKDVLEATIKDGNLSIPFNILPPNERIIIENIGIDVPLIDVKYKDAKSFEDGDYDKELYSGVVKFPTTPNPGEKGNILIFGHTSYYRWKNNKYGTVFSKIPKLKEKDIIKIVRKGQLHKYEIIQKKVIHTSEIKEEYMKHQDGYYLTIMGCYPIGSDHERILLVAKEIR